MTILTRRLFLRQTIAASTAISAGAAIGEAASFPLLSAAALASIAAWQAAQRRGNGIWSRYTANTCRSPESIAIYAEWQAAYEETQDALTAMLCALYDMPVGGAS